MASECLQTGQPIRRQGVATHRPGVPGGRLSADSAFLYGGYARGTTAAGHAQQTLQSNSSKGGRA